MDLNLGKRTWAVRAAFQWGALEPLEGLQGMRPNPCRPRSGARECVCEVAFHYLGQPWWGFHRRESLGSLTD